MRYSLRKAEAADRVFAEMLHERCYKDVVVQQFGSWDPVFQKGCFERKWQPDLFQIIVYRGVDVGVLAKEQRPDHLFLSEIQIDPPAQNQGIGTEIVTDLYEEACSLGLPIRLQVLHRNRAVKLYERLGFRRYGQTEVHFLLEKVFLKRPAS